VQPKKHFNVHIFNLQFILTCDGAANFAFSGPNASAVPYHAILRSLIGLSDSVGACIEFVIANLLGYSTGDKNEHMNNISLDLHHTTNLDS